MNESDIEKAIFDGLRAELEDPVLQQAIEEARYWDEKVRVSHEDDETLRSTIQSSLEERWSQWKGQSVIVTGYAHRVLGEDRDVRPDPVVVTPDDIVVSKGFKIIYTDVDGENIHGNPYGHQYRVVHELQRQLDENRRETLYSFIDHHDVQSDLMSAEYAERWLNHTQNDFINRIRNVTEENRRPETKLVTIGTSCEPALYLDVFNKKNRAAVEAYLNNLIKVDTSVPYIFTTKKGKSIFEDKRKGEPYETTTAPLMAVGRLSKIFFQKINPASINNGAGDWWLSVKATVYDEQAENAERIIILPLRSLKNIRSLREIGYEALRNIDMM